MSPSGTKLFQMKGHLPPCLSRALELCASNLEDPQLESIPSWTGNASGNHLEGALHVLSPKAASAPGDIQQLHLRALHPCSVEWAGAAPRLKIGTHLPSMFVTLAIFFKRTGDPSPASYTSSMGSNTSHHSAGQRKFQLLFATFQWLAQLKRCKLVLKNCRGTPQ